IVKFVPTGLGVAPGRFFVADGPAGTVEIISSSTLAASRPVRVAKIPHGRLVEFLDRLYVPVERGISVVDLSTRRLVRTISLPGTPSDIWIVPTNGLLVATLYSRKQL